MEIVALYVSPGHNFFGHYGQPAGTEPTVPVAQVNCIEGRGLEGDRFFDYKEDYKGQITFFAEEVYQLACDEFDVHDKSHGVFRRNAISRGIDLNSLVGCGFSLQGIRFFGESECSPCAWMDQAFAPGTEAFLKGRGGLRARILSGGTLRVDAGGC